MTMGIGSLMLSLSILTAGAAACAIAGKKALRVSAWGAAIAVTGVIPALGSAVAVLWRGETLSLRLSWQMPFGSFFIKVDPLSALFIILIALVGALSAFYGAGYLKPFAKHKNLGAAWGFYNLLLAGMLLVVTAANGVLFIMAWEVMSLCSFFLVMFEHEKQKVRDAGWVYLTAAHLGEACLLALFVVLGGAQGTLDFDRFVAPEGAFMPSALFVLALLGFGGKAGVMPLHAWMPEVYNAAPSSILAVMSGVMINIGIYGLLRIIPLLGPPPDWWGWALLTIGAISGIMGVLYALCQHELKQLLAYSSIENIGIIYIGLGLWLIGISASNPDLSLVGLMGALLHLCNHALSKSLLFFGAGAIKQSAHTLVLDRLGGLGRLMPKTTRAFLIGVVAICGLPPLNGFVGEFLLYYGAFSAVTQAPAAANLAICGIIAIVVLSAIGVLAAACFAKVFGIIFLGQPRSDEAAKARETRASMWQPMTLLAALSLLLGLGAPLALAVVRPSVLFLLNDPASDSVLPLLGPMMVNISIGAGAILSVTILLAVLRRLLLKDRIVSKALTWDCGFAAPTARMQYTAASFSWPLVRMFNWMVRPRLDIYMDADDFPQKARLASHTRDLFRRHLFAAFFRFIERGACTLHALQQGRIHLYVLYVALTMLVLLVVKAR